VHELDAERLAVGSLQNRDNLAHGAELEAEHVVEEDRAVPVGVGEAVMGRMKLLVVRARREVQRVQIGMEMTRACGRPGSS
jgi:hypothetical protein